MDYCQENARLASLTKTIDDDVVNQSISDLADHLNAMSASFQDIKEQDDCFLKIFLQSEVLSVWHLLQS